MPVSDKHYDGVREHFKALLGGECAVCGSVFSLEFHHKDPIAAGEGRGRAVRMWEWFNAYKDSNLMLVCHWCHCELHDYKDKREVRELQKMGIKKYYKDVKQ